jgi:hypothetical protein
LPATRTISATVFAVVEGLIRPKGKIVCECFEVTDIDRGATLVVVASRGQISAEGKYVIDIFVAFSRGST